MFTTVVVPLDGSPRAASTLELAAELARRAGAALELVTVASPGLDLLDHELALKAACGDVEGVPCAWRVIESNEVDVALAGAVTDTDAILCMATHARTGIARAALGSTAEATVRAATRPVVLVGPHAQVPEDWDVVQACIEPTSELSRRAVPVAVALTRLLGARLWLVEVEPARQLRSDVDVPESAGVAALATALRRDGLDVEWDVLHGDDVAAELLSSQRTLGSSVLVTSSHARRGLTRAALGSVTTSLVHDAVCPVLVVPPTAAGRT